MNHHRHFMRALTVTTAVLLPAATLHANPLGGSVVAGSATIVQQSPNHLNVIEQSNAAIVNWNSFSIAPGEVTTFQQPSSSAWILNRVTGSQASQLEGSLTANGRVVLINPNGVLIGPTATVDAAGFAATTANINNDAFMAGQMNFDQASPQGVTVVNQGKITIAESGFAALVAPGVVNSGFINARLGKVSLAGGTAFTLDLYGDNLVTIAVSGQVLQQVLGLNGSQLDALVSNSGRIDAAGGVIQLTAQAVQALSQATIHQSGTLAAQSYHVTAGTVVLDGGATGTVEVGGTVDATGIKPGQTGGTVEILGETVALTNGAKVNVSGAAGGGTVLIGGNAHGAGPQPDATTTTVAPTATITANALANGNGGKVVVWSNDSTRFDGTITATGGPQGGNGGAVEVSGKQNLIFTGAVDLRAPKGKTGNLLLDPGTIAIDNSGADDGSVGSGSIDAGGADLSISHGKIETLLTTADVSLTASESITVNAAINAPSSAGALLLTSSSIVLNANVATGGGQTYAGGVTLNAPSAQTLSGSAIDFQNTVTVSSGNTATVTSTTGAVTFENTVTGPGSLIANGGAGGVTVEKAVTGLASLTATGATTLDADVTTANSITLSGATQFSAPLTLRVTRTDGSIAIASIQSTTVTPSSLTLTFGNGSGTESEPGSVSLGGTSNIGVLSTNATTVTLTGNNEPGSFDMPYAAINLSGQSAILLADSGDLTFKSIEAPNTVVSLLAPQGAITSVDNGGVVSVDVLGLIVEVLRESQFSGSVAGLSGRSAARRVVVENKGLGQVLFDSYPAIFFFTGAPVDAVAMADAMSEIAFLSDVTRPATRGTQKSPAELAFTDDILAAPYPIELFALDYDLITPTSSGISYQTLSYFNRNFWDRISNWVDERHLRTPAPSAGAAP